MWFGHKLCLFPLLLASCAAVYVVYVVHIITLEVFDVADRNVVYRIS